MKMKKGFFIDDPIDDEQSSWVPCDTGSMKINPLPDAIMGNEIYEPIVNHPKHYNKGTHEAIDVIEDWELGFHCGNALKYIARHMHKGDPQGDIQKAIWYLERYLKIE